MNDATRQFISEHENDDLFALKLKFSSDKNINIDLAIRQISGRQKIKLKVPLFYNTADILYPAQLSLEQSSSEITAKYKSSLCEGNTLVDLTGGFGVDCCFMSERFTNAIYVERQAELCELAKNNFSVLAKNHIKILHIQTEEFITRMQPADWIYIDPARRGKSGNKVVLLSDCEPDVGVLSNLLLEKAVNIMIKLSPMMDITAAVRDLPNTTEIHIISVDNECKEVLLILNRTETSEKTVRTINFNKKNDAQLFEFKQNEEINAHVQYSETIGKYLYEPNAAIMKSGAFKLIGDKFSLDKLHKNTHLYTSNELKTDFPGRIFEVIKEWGSTKSEMKKELEKVSKANISTRNYPIGTDELRKKLKIKDGGDVYLFACTLANEKKTILECKRIFL
jgi:hypothetical protein